MKLAVIKLMPAVLEYYMHPRSALLWVSSLYLSVCAVGLLALYEPETELDLPVWTLLLGA